MGCKCSKVSGPDSEIDMEKEIKSFKEEIIYSNRVKKSQNFLNQQKSMNINTDLQTLLTQKFATQGKRIEFCQVTNPEFEKILNSHLYYNKIIFAIKNSLEDILYEKDIKYENVNPLKIYLEEDPNEVQYYKGSFNDKGQCHGNGIWISNGNIYNGNFTNDKFDGKGLYVNSNGNYYFGDWENGEPNGVGEVVVNDIKIFKGGFKNGKKNGMGMEKYPDETEYMGEFIDDERNGKGKLTFKGGSLYEGEFKNGKFDGKGEFDWADGKFYVGEFSDGKMNGNGQFVWEDGEEFIGTYVNNKKHGKGEYKWKNGNSYVGFWDNNNSVGEGIFNDRTNRKKHYLKYRFGSVISFK